MSLDVDMVLSRDGFRLQSNATFEPGAITTIVGPNASGKSTLLGAICGLVRIDSGSIYLDGRILSSAGAHVPPARRSMGVVFQDLRLFPTRSALDNVAFGLRARGQSRRQARRSAHGWLERLAVADAANLRGDALSGGYAQRVALARALAIEPRVLLMDEPMSALDADARPAIRRVIADVLRTFEGIPILVTHDPLEALSMGQRIVVMERGRIAQIGTPDDIRRHPRSDYAASLVGVNLLAGTIADESASIVTVGASSIAIAPTRSPVGGEVFVSVHPHSIVLSSERPSGSARNAFAGTVRTLEEHDGRVRVGLDTEPPLTVEITPASLASLGLSPGVRIWASFKATDVRVYER